MDGLDEIRVRADQVVNSIGRVRPKNYKTTVQKEDRKAQFIRLLLLGHNVPKCAKILGTASHTLYHWLLDPAVEEAVRERNAKIWEALDKQVDERAATYTERIVEMSDGALRRIEELLQSDNEQVALKAAITVLDRNPETSTHHRADVTNRTFVIDANMLTLAASAALEIEGTPSQP
jgi:hypothetical protein